MAERGRVHRLPEEVANQIAAGEVVERPASVVKELLENAVDAQAGRIDVEVDHGGRSLIRITDDGEGMVREDAVLCLERHATSKIRSFEELSSVRTLGFRGEAIPSIASVSRFSLTTRRRGTDEGTRVRVEGGKLVEVESCGAPEGTTVEVRDLFFNVPAREKFLKTHQTELSHISEAVERLALARPEIALRLSASRRTLLELPKGVEADPLARVGRVLGAKVAGELIPIEEDAVPRPVQVRGWTSAPSLHERTTRGLRVFINGRFVRDRTVQHAIQDAYRTLLERGRYPVAVLWIEVDPDLVDVNVHPQKTEVRFRDTSSVHRAVSGAIARTLLRQPWLGGAADHDGVIADQGRSSAPTPGWEHQARLARSTGSVLREPTAPAASLGRAWERRLEGFERSRAREPDPREPPLVAVGSRSEGRFARLEPIGQVLGTYLVCQGHGRMVLIDQHAAHERIAFENMRRQYRRGQVQAQPLLIPITLELDHVRLELLAAQSERLQRLGFQVEPFGERTARLRALPAALGSVGAERAFLDVLDDLRDQEDSSSIDERNEQLMSRAACHSAVRAGDRLERAEIKSLLEQMDQVDFSAHCPHGRPVFAEWSAEDLAKLFHRG